MHTVLFRKVPDYLDVISQPMDFGTMRKRVESHHYQNLDEFESDFYLVWHNATVYNAKDTIYYRAAIRIKDAGERERERERVRQRGGVGRVADTPICACKALVKLEV